MTSVANLRQKAKLPAKQAGGSTVAAFFEANKPSIAAVLPKHVSPDRMMKIAIGALRATPKLMECTVESLFGAVVQCAQLGLEPNTPMGHAYLIPFSNRRANRTDVQVIMGYRGLLDLARRSGQIVSIAAHAVREHDAFELEYGLNEKLSHKPANGPRGEITHFYAVAKLVGGGHAFEVLTRTDVDTIRDASQGYRMAMQYNKRDSPWIAHYEEMGRKTAIRRLFKYLPVSIELATANALDEAADDGRVQQLDGVLDGDYAVIENDSAPDDLAAPQPEWPKQITDPETGELHWEDARGIRFHPDYHAMRQEGIPAINRDGSFRQKRGADPDAVHAYEHGAPQDKTKPVSVGYPEIMQAVLRAKNEKDLAVANERVLAFDGSHDQAAELVDAVNKQAGELGLTNLAPF